MDEKYLETAGFIAEADVTSGLHKAAKLALPDTLLTEDCYKARNCSDCGADLPEFRMQRGCLLCTECQAVAEGSAIPKVRRR